MNPLIQLPQNSQQIAPAGVVLNYDPSPVTGNNNIGGPIPAWQTQLFDCARDEESCWWGSWCCWIVMARTVETFSLGVSIYETLIFWAGLLLFIILLLSGIGPIAILIGIAIGCFLVWRRANFRSNIRARYNIPGTLTDDLLIHGFCSCCAVCQESREAKLRNLPRLDFCFADSLTEQEVIHEQALGRNNQNLTENLIPESGNFFTHVQAVSRTSRVILVLSCIFSVLSFVYLIIAGRGQNILILFLVFVQPVAILYFVYWRKRRQHALLDFVIKSFAVGFWFTTFQSVIFEYLLQGLIFIAMAPLIGSGLNLSSGDDAATTAPQSIGDMQNSISYGGNAKGAIGRLLFELLNDRSAVEPSTPSTPSLLLSYSRNNFFLQDASVAADNAQFDVRVLLQSHIILVIIALALMAFVVAAGVEETMKHFIVRCCQYPSPLKDPHTVLVYLMAGALGFATCENIEYVFGSQRSPIPGTSMLVGEMLVLLMRVLMPIHVICSVLQAANLSKVLIGEEQMGLFQILLPAYLLHGTFDFILFLLGTLQFIYNAPSLPLEILSLVVSMLITIGGAVWAYKSFNSVQTRFENGWQHVDVGFPREDIGNNVGNNQL